MRILVIVAAALAVLALSVPTGAKDDPKAEADPYHLFRIAGRKWMFKRTPKPGAIGNNTVNYQQFEVVNCHKDKAEIIQTPYDDAKRTDPGREVNITVEFKPEEFMFRDPPGFEKGKVEQLKTDAGTFECTVWTNTDSPDGAAYLWRSNDFPGLVVKQDDQYSSRVLIEFDWVEGDPGYKTEKKKKKKPEPDKIDPKRLYSSKGASWIHRTDITRGERGTKSVEIVQTEVKKVSDESCEVEVTKLTQLLQKIKDEDPETRVIAFDSKFSENLEPKERSRVDRTEKRITKVGLFECTVYTFKDDEGREGTAWYANDWPGLMLRREVKGEGYTAITELIKFEE
jgi:hypothetical protein